MAACAAVPPVTATARKPSNSYLSGCRSSQSRNAAIVMGLLRAAVMSVMLAQETAKFSHEALPRAGCRLARRRVWGMVSTAPVPGGVQMPAEPALRSGGQILVDQLAIHGVDLVFGVPGESYIAVLDALYDARNRMRFITCRMEAGAANMAEAYGKLTGKPGICMVTRGPGATHAAVGVHTAKQDSTPMILFIGQIAREMRDREAFQEVDFRAMFGPLAKWAAEIDDARRIPEYVARAFAVATSGRPGPVVLSLPEDMLTDEVDVADVGPYQPVQASPAAADMERL